MNSAVHLRTETIMTLVECLSDEAECRKGNILQIDAGLCPYDDRRFPRA